MKQKDLALIIVVVVFSGIISFVAGKMIFAAPKNRQQKVEVVDAINTEFPVLETRYFNSESINPTQLIRISEGTNVAPFNGVSN